MKAIFVLVALVAALTYGQTPLGTPISKTVTLYFNGGLPDCKQCDAPGMYACSNGIGNWNNGRLAFKDPMYNVTERDSYFLSTVTAAVYGNFGCDSSASLYSDVKVSLGSDLLQIIRVNNDGNYCACGKCSSVTFGQTYLTGFASFNYGGDNTLYLQTLKNYACVSKVVLTLNYYPKPTRNLKYYSYSDFKSKFNNGSAYCGNYDQYTCSNEDPKWTANNEYAISFYDPLPSNAILYLVNATMYGVWGCNMQTSYGTVSLTLQGILVNSFSVYASGGGCSASTVSCAGGLYFKPLTGYAAGWPKYNYGGQNQLMFAFAKSWVTCMSRVDLSFTYYTRGSNKLTTITVTK